MELNIFFWFLAFLSIVILIIVIQGILYNYVSKQPISLNPVPGTKTEKQECSKSIVQCYDDNDCQDHCSEFEAGQEMKCVEINRYTKDQINNYGSSKSVCLPKYPDMECGQKYGGLLTWSGWSNPDRMEWDCLCSYPEYASNQNCTKLNPNICGGNPKNFDWDATTGKAPDEKFCTCTEGTAKIISRNGLLPLCVPSQDIIFYKDMAANIIPPELKEGDLFTCPESGYVYRYFNFEKRPIETREIGISWDPNYDNDKTKKQLTQAQCDQIPTGRPLRMKILDGTLLKCRTNTGSENPGNNDVFYYDDDTETRRYVQSADIAKSTINDWRNIPNWANYIKNDIDCSTLPRGKDMTFQYDGRTILCKDGNKVYNRYANNTIQRYGNDGGNIDDSRAIAKSCDPKAAEKDSNLEHVINVDNCGAFRVGENITDASKCPK
jgi:hypothetical protein